MWTVGLLLSGNAAGLTLEEYLSRTRLAATPPAPGPTPSCPAPRRIT